jgi:hypothetical protein
MGFFRTMGAGLAGSSRYNVNINTGGGSKKQGLPATRNVGSFYIKRYKKKSII